MTLVLLYEKISYKFINLYKFNIYQKHCTIYIKFYNKHVDIINKRKGEIKHGQDLGAMVEPLLHLDVEGSIPSYSKINDIVQSLTIGLREWWGRQ